MAKRTKKRNNRPAGRDVQPLLRAETPAPLPELPENSQKGRKRHAFSGWPMIIAWLAMLIFTFHACTHMVAAGDTWVAMACGRHFVNHGVDTVEPFSANSHKSGPTEEDIKAWPGWAQSITRTVGFDTVKKWHPTGWVNQNWLTHVIFYSLIPKDSYADGMSFPSEALVYWKFAIYVITVACVFYMGVLLGVNPALSAVFSCFAMFIGRSFLDVRPAGFSNMLVAVFLLILILATYRNIWYIWLIVPVTIFWCNVHGGYIYVFIVMIPFVGLHLLNSLPKIWTIILYNVAAWPVLLVVIAKSKEPTFAALLFIVLIIVLDLVLILLKGRLLTIKLKSVAHLIGAYFAALVVTIVFNPFHFTNLTHTFVISVSEHAKRWRDIHEWHPAFEWTNPVGTAVPFLFMFIIAWLVLAAWVVTMIVTSGSITQSARRKAVDPETYRRPKIDPALMVVAILTIYMAIRSRRFIPIAAIAACPVIALLIDQIIRAILATDSFKRTKKLAVPTMPPEIRTGCIALGAVATVFFGVWWGLRFKLVYLDPWPNDTKFTSVFMRMTASDAKPFYATKFIKMNRMKGNMFNYWTEGGFIAFGQEPDPNTGKTPLQLFMDGRAQAAYNRPAFDLWTAITSGGPTIAAARQKSLTLGVPLQQVLKAEDYKKTGKWISGQLKRHNVWVALMPAGQFRQPFTMGLEYSTNWALVFLNNKQRLFVDVETPEGAAIFHGMRTGKTLYPDEYHKNLAVGHHYLLQKDPTVNRRGFDMIKAAFNHNPSPAPMLEMIQIAARRKGLTGHVADFCDKWVDNFAKNQKQYIAQDGYRLKLEATRLACVHLRSAAVARNNTKLANSYLARINQYAKERERLSLTKRW